MSSPYNVVLDYDEIDSDGDRYEVFSLRPALTNTCGIEIRSILFRLDTRGVFLTLDCWTKRGWEDIATRTKPTNEDGFQTEGVLKSKEAGDLRQVAHDWAKHLLWRG